MTTACNFFVFHRAAPATKTAASSHRPRRAAASRPKRKGSLIHAALWRSFIESHAAQCDRPNQRATNAASETGAKATAASAVRRTGASQTLRAAPSSAGHVTMAAAIGVKKMKLTSKARQARSGSSPVA